MASGIDWFRWHHGSVLDTKLSLVAKKAGASVAEVIAVWACLLEAASANTDRGNPGATDFEALDYHLGIADGASLSIYQQMIARGLVDADTGRLTAWERRQPKREREDDGAAERKRRQREREAESGDRYGITTCHAMSHQKTPREEKSREEVDKTPQTPQGGSVAPQRVAKRNPVRLQTFLDECKANGDRPVRDHKPLWDYCKKAKLPQDFVALAWVEFCRRFTGDGTDAATLQKDWRRKFQKYVEGNYYRLWAIGDDGAYYLTTQGKQAQTAAGEA